MWKCSFCETKNNDEILRCIICQTTKEESNKYAEKMKEKNVNTTFCPPPYSEIQGKQNSFSARPSSKKTCSSKSSISTKPYYDDKPKLEKTTEPAIHPIHSPDLGKTMKKPVDDFSDIDSIIIKKTTDDGMNAKSIIAALAGGIPGILLWILANEMGYKLSLLAFVIAFGVFWACEKSGGRITSKKNIFICLLIIVIDLYVAVHLSWSIAIFNGVKNLGGYKPLYNLIIQLYELLRKSHFTDQFVDDLIKSYIFGIIGCFGFIIRLWTFNKRNK